MRRLLSALACVVALSSAPASALSPAQSVCATIIMVWAPADPRSTLADVRCMDVALRAPFEIGAPARALRAHPAARFAIAISPSYANAIDCAGADPVGAASQATGLRTDPRTRDVLRLLATLP